MKLDDYIIILDNGNVIINHKHWLIRSVYEVLQKERYACHYTGELRILCLILEGMNLVHKRRFNDYWDDFYTTDRGRLLCRRLEQKLKVNKDSA